VPMLIPFTKRLKSVWGMLNYELPTIFHFDFSLCNNSYY
jgi:hypothetical protein